MPPRLKKIRTEMKPKNRKRIPARRHRLLLRCLKTPVQTREEACRRVYFIEYLRAENGS
jgi:hypothetical protein